MWKDGQANGQTVLLKYGQASLRTIWTDSNVDYMDKQYCENMDKLHYRNCGHIGKLYCGKMDKLLCKNVKTYL